MKECKLYGSGEISEIKKIKSPVNSNDYSLYHYQSCKSAFFNIHDHPVDLKEMYDDFVDRAEFPFEFIPPKKWLTEKKTAEKLLKKSPSSVLDVECLTGDKSIFSPFPVFDNMYCYYTKL